MKSSGYAANAFGKIFADGIGLLKIIMRIIDEDGDALRNIIAHGFLDARKRILGDLGAELSKLVAAFVIINIEMRRLNIFPMEFLVLNLIFPKIRTLAKMHPLPQNKERQ